MAQEPSHADILRGGYGKYRANNDLLSYGLDIRIDPVKKTVAGKNTIKFRMLSDDTRIQLDLYDNLNIDKITLGSETLKYTRDSGAVFIDFPRTLKTGKTYSIDFFYSARRKPLGGLAVSHLEAIRPVDPGYSRHARGSVQAFGGRTKINGRTRSRI